MHPSFGIEFVCPSMKWEDVLRGPSQAAVLAHTDKVLNYRSIFGSTGVEVATGPAELEAVRRVSSDGHSFAERRAAA